MLSLNTKTLFAVAALAILAALGSPLCAQDSKPHPELAKMDPFLGHWEGSGSSRMAAGADPVPWTARSHSRRVLGGHFVREDMLLDIQAGAPFPIQIAMIYFHAYDAKAKRFVSYIVNNEGGISIQHNRFVAKNKLVTWATNERDSRDIERWTTTYGKDSLAMKAIRIEAEGEPFTFVEGEMRRVDATDRKPLDVSAQARFAMAQQSQEMKRYQRACGHYQVKGEVAMAAGGATASFEGETTVRSIFGGMAQVIDSKNLGMTGFTAVVWNERLKRFDAFSLSSMGEHQHFPAHLIDDEKLAFTFSPEVGGVPSTLRTILTMDEKGKMKSGEAMALMGADQPFRTFTCLYELTEEK